VLTHKWVKEMKMQYRHLSRIAVLEVDQGTDSGAGNAGDQEMSDENPTTGAETKNMDNSDQTMQWLQNGGENFDSDDYDETPLRFRDLEELYQDSEQVQQDTDVEMEALLTVMEEPSSYADAATDRN
jgi:hypothetical protein